MATAQEVIDRARELINDVASTFVSGLRWSDAELLRWLTDGQREIVKLKPEANSVTSLFTVIGGSPRQRLDSAVAYRLIRVEANGSAAAPQGGVLTSPVVTSIVNGLDGGLNVTWSAAEFDGESVGSYELYGIDSGTYDGTPSFEGQLVFADLPLVTTVDGSTLTYWDSTAPSDESYQSAYLVRAIAAVSATESDSAIAYGTTPS